MTLARYAPVSREVKPPRPDCPACKVPMWFDGRYRRRVRQDGAVHELVVHRVRCPRCRAGHAVLPDFVVARRLDSAVVIGAALAACAGVPGAALPAGVPARTIRSWRARFTVIAIPVAAGFSSLAAERGWQPVDLPCDTPEHAAMAAIGAAWHTTLDRWPGAPLRGPWRFASAMCGGALMSIRTNVPRRSRPLRHSGSRPP